MPARPFADGQDVLRSPQHYHVSVLTYEREDPATKQLLWSTRFDLVANDVSLAVDRAKRMADREHAHVQEVRQCAEKDHLSNA